MSRVNEVSPADTPQRLELWDVCLWTLWAGWILAGLLIWAPVSWGQRITFGRGLGNISGSVQLAAENRGAGGVRVEVRALRGGATLSTVTDGTGRFQMGGLPAGSYVVSVDRAGYERAEQTVEARGTFFDLMFRMRRIASSVARVGNFVSVRELRIPSKARTAFEKGIERLGRKNDASGSLNYFRQAAAAYPSYYEAYYQIGVAEMRLEHHREAEEALQRAIDLSGGNYAEPQFALSALVGQQGKFAEAEAISRRGLLLDSASATGRVSLAMALYGQNRFDEAERNCQEALRRSPESPIAHVVLANVYGKKGRSAAVVEQLNAYLKLQPNGAMSAKAREIVVATEKQLADAKKSETIAAR